jgi:Immunity protein Imm1
MRKWCSFPSCDFEGWPEPTDIAHYFRGRPEEKWRFDIGEDSAAFTVEGLDGTDHLPPLDSGRSNITLYLQVHPIFGMLLQWTKWDGRRQEGHTYVSKGDLARLGQFVWGGQGSLYPVALFIPYAMAWKAVKEFLETDGALPKSIEWIAARDVPEETFPEPTAPRFDWKRVTSFAGVVMQGWPRPKDIKRYFLAPPGQRWFFDMDTDKATFELHGIDGTEHLEQHKDRIDIRLTLWGHPTLGVLFNWTKWGGGFDDIYASKGDVTRLRERAERVHGGTLPVGLFVPYEAAWKALNEFFETDGALPKSIEWIAELDLPPEFRRKHKR